MPRRNQPALTVEEILKGTRFGRTQSVGHMEVIPILDDGGADDTFAPPDFGVSNHNYGEVDVTNESQDRPTILPTGTGWVTQQRAQDHAVPSAKLIKPGESKHINTAMCIEETQGGYIQGAKDFLVLPASLRAKALSTRNDVGYSRLWDAIGTFNNDLGVSRGGGHLVRFLKEYETQLDEFVAEFELVPDQLGAVILIGGKVVGVERAPNVPFWERLWVPLVRVCYGSLAIKAGRMLGDTPSATRTMLNVKEKSLAGIRLALRDATAKAEGLIEAAFNEVRSTPLLYAGAAEGKLDGAELFTVANTRLAGQIVLHSGESLKHSGESLKYVSLCAAGV